MGIGSEWGGLVGSAKPKEEKKVVAPKKEEAPKKEKKAKKK